MLETLPFTYFAAALLLGCMGTWAVANLRKTWAPPFLAVLFTFAFWYMVEPLYVPEEFQPFSQAIVWDAYAYGIVFLLAFALSFLALAPVFRPARRASAARLGRKARARELARTADRLVVPLAIFWAVLAAYGTWRVGGDVVQALFPLEGRSGLHMWQRSAGAGAGASGFLVSAASYLYLLVSAAFGALLPLARKRSTRLLLVVLIALSWPYLFLQGSRAQTLIAVLPMVASFYMFGRASAAVKVLAVVLTAAALYIWFGIVIQMRSEQAALTEITLGSEFTNMASELCWMLHFQQNDLLQPSLGAGYVAEVLNFVPRAIWPNKPLIGIDYAIMRGFGGASTDMGLRATISTGMVGQGMANFGRLPGSIFAGLLMALWAGFLWRLRVQASVPRLLLFALGLALTINLGRDITLLTLFPFVFGYLAVLGLEFWQKHRRRARRRQRGRRPQGVLTRLDAERSAR